MWRFAVLLLLVVVAMLPAARPRQASAPPPLAANSVTASPTPTPTTAASATATSTPVAAPEVTATPTTSPGAAPTPDATPASTPAPTATATSLTVVDRYLAAAALLDDDPAAAAEAFQSIADGSSFLAPFARLREAEAFVAAELPAPAAAAYSAVTADATTASSLRLGARFAGAELLVELADIEGALALLAGVSGEPASSASDRAAMHWRRAELLRQAEDSLWIEAARRALVAAPGSAAAAAAADALIDAEAGASSLDLAYAYYRSRRNSDARELYETVIASAAPADELAFAHFYLGALAERTSERTRALEQYAASLEMAPAGPLADDSRYWRGRVLEELGEHALAVDEYDLLLLEYPGSRFVEDAVTRAAVRVGLGGEPAEAALRFGELVGLRDGTAAATAAHWQQLFAQLAGDDPLPVALAASFDPSSLAALLDETGANWLSALPPSAASESPLAWSGAEISVRETETDDWLAERFGPAPAESSQLGRLPLVQQLLAVDEQDFARLVLRDELDAQSDPHGRVAVARTASLLGLHDVALIAAIRVLGTLSPLERLDSPRELERLAYPIPFADEVDAAIGDSALPPLLLYALVRQESAFNPTAGSRAGALGLTQVIVPTGQAIAEDLREPFDIDALFEPATSLRFGAHYLSTQIDSFAGNVLAALAAYNGGPGNASYWLTQRELPGADGFLYAVEFSETRRYLERVIENYAWYRYLYLDLEAPALPWPASTSAALD